MKMPAEQWVWRAGWAAGMALAALADRWSGGGLAFLYCVPVMVAGINLGWMEAVLVAGGATVLGGMGVWQSVGLACVCAAAVWMGVARRRQVSHYRKLAEQLSGVYERVQANYEGMKRAERLSALGQLSAGLAHEIRNPLASIIGAAEILSRRPDLDAKQSRCVEIIVNECQRLNGLLTNFLNFAKPRAPRLRAVDLEPVMDNVLALAAHGVRGKTVRFDRSAEAGLPRVECDAEQLEQVLLNLMINAIEASPEGGTVEMAAERQSENVEVRVTDAGSGVSAAHVDRLFDPFFTTKENGTGLGLPVAHQIVRQMGGTLEVRRNEGPGMTFSVVLPATEVER